MANEHDEMMSQQYEYQPTDEDLDAMYKESRYWLGSSNGVGFFMDLDEDGIPF